ncbi:unnamed protein product, partial [Symbiodinium necroappetens]
HGHCLELRQIPVLRRHYGRHGTCQVMVCASSAAMALSFDAGGSQRQRNFWALMTDRNSGPGKGVDELSAGSAVLPRDVAKWIRDNSTHPVIWHMPDRKYRFASELHAEAAAAIFEAVPIVLCEKRSTCGSAGCTPTNLGVDP